MIENLATRFTDVLIKEGKADKKSQQIIIYGIIAGTEMLLNIITTIILGILFDMLLHSIVFLLAYILVRSYAGGYHCSTYKSCYILSTAIVISVLAIVQNTPTENQAMYSLFLLISSVLTLVIYAPVETANKPLDHSEKIYYRKKMIFHLILEIIMIISLFYYGFSNYGYIITLSIASSALLVICQILIMRRNISSL